MQLARLIFPLVVAALAGCASNKLTTEPAAAPPTFAPSVETPLVTAPPAQPAQTTSKTATLHPLDDPNSALAKRSVYFDFDSSAIRDTDKGLIEAHAKYLASSSTAKARIEGNCDERGGREYNLALGQRRAEAVVKSLTLLGAQAGAMEAISYGKEKPVDPGHDESAWAKNRRADVNYLKR